MYQILDSGERTKFESGAVRDMHEGKGDMASILAPAASERRMIMGDMMTFPATVEEFMEQYKMTDTEHVYSNGTEYVPIYRMKQWFEHCRNQHLLRAGEED